MTNSARPPLPDITTGDDTVLWRYLDLHKWLDMLQTSEIHLARADQMEDRWEGASSPVNVAMRPEIYGADWPVMAPIMQQKYEHSRTHIFLNCWYVGQGESYAMWKLYDLTGKGVAIRTTFGKLKETLLDPSDRFIWGTKVEYVDYSKIFIPENNMFSPYVYKRSSFSHECEYRLLKMWHAKENEPDSPPVFLREPVDLNRLIEAVYVSPDAPNWVAHAVEKVTHKYMPTLTFKHSNLATDPVS